MKKKFQTISVVLNVYNESAIIEECLEHIRNQKYPQKKVEIIIVDDDSTDDTIPKAKKFNVKVVRSGFRNRERAKSVGLEHVKGDLILFMDADVLLKSINWFKRCNELFLTYPEAAAIQSIRWDYKKNDSLVNRYSSLFGVNDPFVFFLGKRGVLMATERKWNRKDTILVKGRDYYLVRFSADKLPTMGAQGFIMKRNLLRKTSWKPYFFHLEAVQELVQKGYNIFILTTLPIEHRFVDSINEYYSKMSRNIRLYLRLKKFRKYSYGIGSARFFLSLFLMLTVIFPLYQSLKGYIKKPDFAWFLHPILSFTIPPLYAYEIFKFKLENLHSGPLKL